MSEHSYYLRSRSDKQPSVSVSTSSPMSPPTSPSPIQSTAPSPPNVSKPCIINKNTKNNQRKRRSHRRRKRKFSQIDNNNDDLSDNDNNDNSNNNQDIDLNVTTNNNKKRKLSRKIKFTLNDETVISREASLASNSPIIIAPRRHIRRIEEFEVAPSHRNRIRRRNPYICEYTFFSGYTIGICSTLGASNDLKSAIKILCQELVSGRAKASLQTQKNSYLVYIKNRKLKMIACSILHIDNIWNRVNIDMFAVDEYWRGNGFASMMVYLIQYRMIYYNKYDLFVCAANDAVPFWSNKKYNFLMAHKGILEQHELEDEKHGGTKHLIWFGSCIQARYNLLKCFINTQ